MISDVLAPHVHRPEFYGEFTRHASMTREIAFGIAFRFARIWMCRELARGLTEGLITREYLVEQATHYVAGA